MTRRIVLTLIALVAFHSTAWANAEHGEGVFRLDAASETSDGRGGRLTAKVLAAVMSGGVLSVAGGYVGARIENCDRDEFFCGLAGALLGGSIGYTIGVTAGISLIDREASVPMTFAGSLIGLGAGIGLTSLELKMWPSLILGPVVGGTIFSERSRSGSAGWSVRPETGGASVAKTFRF